MGEVVSARYNGNIRGNSQRNKSRHRLHVALTLSVVADVAAEMRLPAAWTDRDQMNEASWCDDIETMTKSSVRAKGFGRTGVH